MGMRNRDNEINSREHVLDLLTDYIDRSLPVEDRKYVRAHLEDCTECRAGYIELQATRQMLQSMPVAAAPRAFTLTPEMASKARKTSLLERLFAPRLAPTFATGSVAAFALLLMLFASTSLFSPGGFTPAAPEIATTFYKEDPSGTAAQDTEVQRQANNDAQTNATATTGSAAGSSEAPTEPVPGALVPAPTQGPSEEIAAEPVTPDTAAGVAPEVTPDTDIADTGISSPTTVTLSNTDTAGTIVAYSDQPPAEGEVAFASVAEEQAGWSLLLMVEVGLLVVGILLALAAFLVRRRAV